MENSYVSELRERLLCVVAKLFCVDGAEFHSVMNITYVIDLSCQDSDWRSSPSWWRALQSALVDQVQSPCMRVERSSPHFHFDSSAKYWDFRLNCRPALSRECEFSLLSTTTTTHEGRGDRVWWSDKRKSAKFCYWFNSPCPYRGSPCSCSVGGYLDSMTSFSLPLLEILICFSCCSVPLETLLTADEHLSQSNSSLIVNYFFSLVPRASMRAYCCCYRNFAMHESFCAADRWPRCPTQWRLCGR